MQDRLMYKTILDLERLLPSRLKAELEARPFPPLTELVELADEMLKVGGGTNGDLVRLALAPSAPSRCSDELIVALADLANRYDTPIVSHIQESKATRLLDERNYSKTGVAHLQELGVLNSRFGVIHGVWLSEEDKDLIADSGANVITNPVSNLKLGNGIGPMIDLRRRGANIALGTDGPTANDSANMFEAMKMFALVQRAWTAHFEEWPTAADALRTATLGGALTVGEPDQVGSIEAGKQADMSLLDRDNIAYLPFHRPIRQLVFADTGGSVDKVLVAGRVVVDGGRVCSIPRDEVLSEFRRAYAQVIPAVDAAVERSERFQPYAEEAYVRATGISTQPSPVLW
jgi:guanine deaminase